MQPPISQPQQILARAVAAHQAGNISEAEFLYTLVLRAEKKQFDALHMLGVIEVQRGTAMCERYRRGEGPESFAAGGP
jgi:hypothetical protein